jgi:hypothetical protein
MIGSGICLVVMAALSASPVGLAPDDAARPGARTIEWRLFDGTAARVAVARPRSQAEDPKSAQPIGHARCVRIGVDQVRPLLAGLRSAVRPRTQSELVDAIAALAQSVEFELRRGPHLPIETLDLWKGDCEDKSILAAALLQAAGIDVVLLKFRQDRHMAVAAALAQDGAWVVSLDGTRYTYIECTGYGWRPGRLPPDLDLETPVVIRIPPDDGQAATDRAPATPRP